MFQENCHAAARVLPDTQMRYIVGLTHTHTQNESIHSDTINEKNDL